MAPSEGSEGAGCGKRKRGLGPHSSEEEALEWLRTDVLGGKNLPVYEKVGTKTFEHQPSPGASLRCCRRTQHDLQRLGTDFKAAPPPAASR